MIGPVLVHRGDILAGLKSMYLAHPEWLECLRAVAVAMDVGDEFDAFVAAEQAAAEVSG